MLNRFLWIGLVAVCGFLFTGCGNEGSSAPEPTPEEVEADLDSQLEIGSGE